MSESLSVQGTNLETPGIRARNQHKHLTDLIMGYATVIASPERREEMERAGLIVTEPGSGVSRVTIKGRRRINPRGD
jgi:hypothetical protein